MTTEKLLDLIPYLISLCLSLAILLYAWSKRSIRGARVFWIYMTWETLWLVCYLAGMITESFSAKVFWDSAKWIAGLLAIITIPYFVFSYLEYKLKRPRLFFFILVTPALLFMTAIFTDPLFHLIYVNPEIIAKGVFTELTFDLTWIIFAGAIYAYLTAFASFAFLNYKAPKNNRFFRAQVIIITIGGLMPILGTVFALGENRLLPLNDLSPFFGGIGNLILAWGLFRFRVFELLPIAREVILETMEDAVIVLDSQDRIVDINQQAFKTLRIPKSKVIGNDVLTILKGWPNIAERFEKRGNFTSEVYYEEGGEFYHYDVRSTVINSQEGDYLGRVFVARDVTSYARLQWNLEQLKNNLEKRVNEQTREIQESYETTLEGWAKALELRDKETEGHSRRVVDEAVTLAKRMGVPEEEIVHLRRGAILHDIGKMVIPDEILRKPSELSPEEWQVVRKHPLSAYELLSPIPYLQKAIDIPYCHHEHWDGTGYPRGLKGEEIPLAARIFSVVDVWDALLSDRSYSRAWSKEKALAFIRDNAGSLFDPKVVEVFLDWIEDSSSN